MIRVLIVDDEALARRKTRRLLEVERDVEVVGEARDRASAVRLLRTVSADLVFLDILMPGGSGFDIIEDIGCARMPWVVFVTVHGHFAVQAFEVHALDYLLKPVDPDRLAAVMQGVRAALGEPSTRDMQARLVAALSAVRRHARDRRLLVESRAGDYFVALDDVRWIESDGNYVHIHTTSGTHLVRGSLAALAQRLDPGEFLRVSRFHLVRRDAIRKVEPLSHGDQLLTLEQGAQLTWTRRFRRRQPVLTPVRVGRRR